MAIVPEQEADGNAQIGLNIAFAIVRWCLSAVRLAAHSSWRCDRKLSQKTIPDFRLQTRVRLRVAILRSDAFRCLVRQPRQRRAAVRDHARPFRGSSAAILLQVLLISVLSGFAIPG